MANLDKKLEDASVLAKLDQQKEPDEVLDSKGEVAQDCKEVSCQELDGHVSNAVAH